VTSYNQLTRDALAIERQNMLNPDEPQLNAVERLLDGEYGSFVAASDFVKSLPNGISRWFPDGLVTLGTDGFGLSESRPTLRDHFEVDARYIAWAALADLYKKDQISVDVLNQARNALDIPTQKIDPAYL
jgi:pyruvate dehydrogenase E1 component